MNDVAEDEAAAGLRAAQQEAQRVYQEALTAQRAELMLVEGMDIREGIQIKVWMPLLLSAHPSS